MRAIKYLGSSITLIVWFLCIIIIGKHFAGLYIFYILLGLTHGGIHSILGMVGITLVLVSKISRIEKTKSLKAMLNFIGGVLMLLSLWLFFKNDIDQYNYQTLHQAVPIAIIAGFVLLVIFFCALNMKNAFKNTAP